MNNKSQMEILGLAIVFVLIILGFLLYLRFSGDISKTPKEEYLLPAKAQSILTAMLRTSVECCDDASGDNCVSYSISDLLKDGADITLGDIQCWNFDDDGPNSSEEYAQEQMDILLGRSMEVWDEDYWYKAAVGNNVIVQGKGVGDESTCSEDSRQRDTGFHAIELRTDTLEITFGICT